MLLIVAIHGYKLKPISLLVEDAALLGHWNNSWGSLVGAAEEWGDTLAG